MYIKYCTRFILIGTLIFAIYIYLNHSYSDAPEGTFSALRVGMHSLVRKFRAKDAASLITYNIESFISDSIVINPSKLIFYNEFKDVVENKKVFSFLCGSSCPKITPGLIRKVIKNLGSDLKSKTTFNGLDMSLEKKTSLKYLNTLKDKFDRIDNPNSLRDNNNRFSFEPRRSCKSFKKLQFLLEKLIGVLLTPRGVFMMPRKGYCGWHTNFEVPGIRIYVSLSQERGLSFFKHVDPISRKCYVSIDSESLTKSGDKYNFSNTSFADSDAENKEDDDMSVLNIRIFRVGVRRREDVWHCLGSLTNRYSWGFMSSTEPIYICSEFIILIERIIDINVRNKIINSGRDLIYTSKRCKKYIYEFMLLKGLKFKESKKIIIEEFKEKTIETESWSHTTLSQLYEYFNIGFENSYEESIDEKGYILSMKDYDISKYSKCENFLNYLL